MCVNKMWEKDSFLKRWIFVLSITRCMNERLLFEEVQVSLMYMWEDGRWGWEGELGMNWWGGRWGARVGWGWEVG